MEEPREDHQQTLFAGSVTDDSRPQQFNAITAWLHAQRERTREVTLNWRPSHTLDVRDLRSPELLGETLLRMQTSLGSLGVRHDFLESVR